MAEFSIMSKDGQSVRATGSPVYVGTFLEPGYLEFSEIGSPVPIDWQAGDYVDYPRTGLRYRLYTTPKSLKQGERNLYGGSFVYENVQFHDITKELDLAPFIDLVPSDNLIHFSTLNSFSFVGTPANLAERVQACLNYWFPDSGWVVNVISGLDPTEDADLIETLAAETEFSFGGVTCAEALDKVYDIYGLGWSFSVTGGVNTITIGAPNKRTSSNTTTAYSRIGDNGLVAIARSVSNVDEMGTRLYAYGSMRNMPTDYYRGQNIKDAESVDIEHLMLPINSVASLDYDGWGLTDNLPDARLAYIEDADAVSAYGLIPRYAYFDGSDSKYPDIYPSIEGATIGEVIDGKAEISDTSYVPSLSVWSRDDKIDEVVSAVNPSDAGGVSTSGAKYDESGDYLTEEGNLDSTQELNPATLRIGLYTPAAPEDNLYASLNVSGEVNISSTYFWDISVVARVIARSPSLAASQDFAVTLDSTTTEGVYSFDLEDAVFNLSLPGMTSAEVVFYVVKNGYADFDYTLSADTGSVFLGWSTSLNQTFTVNIPQVGFNIIQYADMGNGKTISMRTGMCAGRSFPIKATRYNSSTDTWTLSLGRVKDNDTGLWYPNADYPIEAGDKYVLLDIAMPPLYIAMASIRLLKAAQKLLADIASERPFYEPSIDSKRVYNEERVLREGMWMHLDGDEVVDGGEDYALIDTLRIDEGSSNIPVYEVTLRKRKPVEWAESISASSSSTSSTSVDDSSSSSSSSSSSAPDWFVAENYESGGSTFQRLKLNPKYAGMYADGWVSAGGISEDSGQTIVASLKDLSDVSDTLNPVAGQYLYYDGTEWTSRAVTSGGSVSSVGLTMPTGFVVTGSPVTDSGTLAVTLASGYFIPTTTLWAQKQNTLTFDTTPTSGSTNPVTSGGIYTALSSFVTSSALSTALASYLPLAGGAMANTNLVTNLNADLLDGKHLSEIFASDITGNAATATKLQTARTLWGQPFDGSANVLGDMTGVGKMTFSAQSSASAQGSGFILEVVNIGTEEAPDYALHSTLPFYSDGFVSAGGVSSGSGGGGGSSTLAGLDDVSLTTLSSGQSLVWNGTAWANTALSINDLSDVDTVTTYPNSGQALLWNGTNWVPGDVSAAGSDKLFYGTSDTAAGTAEKVVTCPEFTSDDLVAGTVLVVRFSNYNDRSGSSNTYLNVNGTGRVAISNSGASYISWAGYEPVMFTYDGSFWRIGLTRNFVESHLVWSPTYASEDSLGLVKVKYNHFNDSDELDVNYQTTMAGRYYYIEFNRDGQLVVNVPWTGGSGTGNAAWGTEDTTNKTIELTVDGTTKTLCLDGYAGGGGSYLPLSGGNMTGSINMRVASSTSYYGYRFANGSTYYGRISANTSGLVGVYANGNITLRPGGVTNRGLVVSTEDVTFNGTSLLGGGGSTVSVSTLYTSGTPIATITVDGTTKTLYAPTSSSDPIDLSNYVTLDGTQTISGAKTFTASSLVAKSVLPYSNSSYNLGSSSRYWNYAYTKRVYLSANVYIEYDSTNACVRVYGAGIATESYISAGGVQ